MKILANKYMELALNEAEQAAQNGEVPVGAVIVHGPTDKILALTSNRVITDHDPTAHAELLAIRKACKALESERLGACDLYVTLEPCPMCAQAISFARIRRLYFAASDEKGGAVENGPRLYHASSCHHAPEVYGGMAEQKSARMLKDFFREKR